MAEMTKKLHRKILFRSFAPRKERTGDYFFE